MPMIATAETILEFWFSDQVRPLWFNATAAFDQALTEQFQATWQAAAAGALEFWVDTPSGALALVIVLDQFPLNMFRGRPESFATEAQARTVARQAIDRGLDQALADSQKAFLYLPFMHSEDLADQDYCVALFSQAGLVDSLKWTHHHRELIRRFGRFPHRNAILGRQSTPEELDYLRAEGAFLG